MQVQFQRTNQHRYAITIFRENFPTIVMNPAPGFDPLMPHDLLHLVVEHELGLRHGIFGQIAAGGNAGTFHLVPSAHENKRVAARLRRKSSRRGARLLQEGRDDSALSERAAQVCFNEWLSRASKLKQRKLANELFSQSKQPNDPDGILSGEAMNRICASLDLASEGWRSLKIGESLVIKWLAEEMTITTGYKLEQVT